MTMRGKLDDVRAARRAVGLYGCRGLRGFSLAAPLLAPADVNVPVLCTNGIASGSATIGHHGVFSSSVYYFTRLA